MSRTFSLLCLHKLIRRLTQPPNLVRSPPTQVRASESTRRSSPSSRSGSRTSRWDTARMAGGSISSFAVGNWTATRTAGVILGTCGARCRLRAGSYTCHSRCGPLFCFPSFLSVSPEGNRAADAMCVFVNRNANKTNRPHFPSSPLVSSDLWPSTRPALGFRRSSASYLVSSCMDSSAFGPSSSRV